MTSLKSPAGSDSTELFESAILRSAVASDRRVSGREVSSLLEKSTNLSEAEHALKTLSLSALMLLWPILSCSRPPHEASWSADTIEMRLCERSTLLKGLDLELRD